MAGTDESGVANRGVPKGRFTGPVRWGLLLVCIIGAVMMTLVGMDLLSAVDLGSSEFGEAYSNDETFVLHGEITFKDETPRDDAEWAYSIIAAEPDFSWPASVSSDYDLGEVGDEVYFKAKRNRGAGGIPEAYYITAESGPISPLVAWAGLAMVISGLSSMVLLERGSMKRLATAR